MPDGPRDLDSLRAAVAACRLCGDLVTPPGVIWARPHHRAAIIGQAPGSLEVTRQMPFVGPAGRRLREWLAPLGAAEEAAFHERFAVIALTAALATPRTTFIVLLSWGGFALLYTSTGRLLRTIAQWRALPR